MSGIVKISLLLLVCTVVCCHSLSASEDAEDSRRPVRRREKRLAETTVALISAGISAGASLGTAGLSALLVTGYSVELGLEIENYSKYTMHSANDHNTQGYISTPARTVLPSKREAMVMHKAGGTATGAVGTVAWKIGNTGYSVAVMYSMPYSFDFHYNWLSVGIRESDSVNPSYSLYSEMYYGSQTWFKRDVYYDHSRTVEYCRKEIKLCVQGKIGTGHKSKGHIYLIPQEYDDLAPNLKTIVDESGING